MKNSRKIIVAAALVIAVSATSVTAMAASGFLTPAEIVSDLTGKSVETITAEKVESGETYGALSSQYGVLDEFKSQMLEQKKSSLDERVAEGSITRERADAIMTAIKANQANCDGSGSGGIGAKMGAGFGNRMSGNRNGGKGGLGYACGAAVNQD